jgi:hypothetical protein
LALQRLHYHWKRCFISSKLMPSHRLHEPMGHLGFKPCSPFLYMVLPTCWQGAFIMIYVLCSWLQDISATQNYTLVSYYTDICTLFCAITWCTWQGPILGGGIGLGLS